MMNHLSQIKEKAVKFIRSKDAGFLAIFFSAIALLIILVQSDKTGISNTADILSAVKDTEVDEGLVATTTVKKAEGGKSIKKTVSLKTPVANLKAPEAKSAYIYDIKEKKMIFGNNEDLLLPLASMTKIMTAIVALEELDNQSIITIDQKTLDTEGESGLKLGEKWKVSDLVKLMLVVSSNDAAAALKNEVDKSEPRFIALMNQKARDLGLKDILFINETGLDQSEKTVGSYGSAKDIAVLMKYAVDNHGKAFEPTRYKEYNLTSESGRLHHLLNTNSEVESIQNTIASKTGYTSLAGGNLVFVFDAGKNHPVVISIFGSTKNGRFDDAKKYADMAITEIIKDEEIK